MNSWPVPAAPWSGCRPWACRPAAPRRPRRTMGAQSRSACGATSAASTRTLSFRRIPTSNAMALLYNGLTEADANTNIVPALAHAWETSKDGLTWTWHIRKDVTFHNGRPMTGADVKANIERVLTPKVGSVIRGELEIIDRMDMLDDYTLRMTLKDKYYPLPAMLTNRWLPIPRPTNLRDRQEAPHRHRAIQIRLLEAPAHHRHGPSRGVLGTGRRRQRPAVPRRDHRQAPGRRHRAPHRPAHRRGGHDRRRQLPRTRPASYRNGPTSSTPI